MLFDDDVEEQVKTALVLLEGAEDMGVPYPFVEQVDLKMLASIRKAHPTIELPALVEKFLFWCMDVRFWEEQKVVRWRSRLQTWVRNEQSKSGAGRGWQGSRRSGGTHHAAAEGRHGDATEALERW